MNKKLEAIIEHLKAARVGLADAAEDTQVERMMETLDNMMETLVDSMEDPELERDAQANDAAYHDWEAKRD